MLCYITHIMLCYKIYFMLYTTFCHITHDMMLYNTRYVI